MWPFDSIFPDPAKKASPYLDKIPGTIEPYYRPYVQAGADSLGKLQDQYNRSSNPANLEDLQRMFGGLTSNQGGLQNQYSNMMNNPGDIISKIGAGYKKSPGYDFELNQGEQEINNAAARGGMLGTPQHQQYAGDLASMLASKDFHNYLSDALGVQAQGLQGNQNLFNVGAQGKQNLYNTGLSGFQALEQGGQQASGGLAENLAQALMSQANLKYAGQANQNQQTGGLIGNILSAISGSGGGMGGGGGGSSSIPAYAQSAMYAA